jgi:hypothetical protein
VSFAIKGEWAYVRHETPTRPSVQHEVCHGARVLRIVVLPEVESETGVAGGLGRRFEETSKEGTGDEPVRVDDPAR